jgi:hypothetical protein
MPSSPLVQVISRGTPTERFGGFGAMQDYVERFTAAVSVRRARRLTNTDPVRAMDAVYAQAPRSTPNPAYHFVLSWAEEHAQHALVWETVEKSLKALKLDEHQWIAAIHGDTAHTHAHVLVNRVHPENLTFWHSGGRDHETLMAAIGSTRNPRPTDYIKPQARTLEVLTGQVSFQRWLRSHVSPAVDALLKAGATWGAVKGEVAAEFGLRVRRGAAGVLLSDEHPAVRRKKPLQMAISALRLDYDFRAIDDAWTRANPHEADAPIDHERGYCAAFARYELRTPQTMRPDIAPLYDRFVAERQDWYDRGIHELRARRRVIHDVRDARIAAIKNEFALESKNYLATASAERRSFFRLVTAPIVLAQLRKEEIARVRADARRATAAIAAEYPSPIFRKWLKTKAAAGDLDAKKAIFSLRTGHVHDQLLLELPKESQPMHDPQPSDEIEQTLEDQEQEFDGMPDPAPSLTPVGPTPIDAEIPVEVQDRADDQLLAEEEEFINTPEPADVGPDALRAPPQRQHSLEDKKREREQREDSIESAVARFGDAKKAQKLILGYQTYIADFIGRDPTGVRPNQAALAERRRKVVADWDKKAEAAIEALPDGQRPHARALHLARKLKNEAAHETAQRTQRKIVESIVHHSHQDSIYEYLNHHHDPDAKKLSALLPANLTFEYPELVPKVARKKTYLQTLEGQAAGEHVHFTVNGHEAFADHGDDIRPLNSLLFQEDAAKRAMLEYAAAKFGGEVEITGSKHYKMHMLRIAVDMGIPVTNPELADIQQKLIEKKRLEDAKRPQPALPAQPTALAERWNATLNDANLTPEERSTAINALVKDAVYEEVNADRVVPWANDGAKGVVENVLVFRSLAYAVMRDERTNESVLVEIPRLHAQELAVAIGEVHDLTRERFAKVRPQAQSLQDFFEKVELAKADRAAEKREEKERERAEYADDDYDREDAEPEQVVPRDQGSRHDTRRPGGRSHAKPKVRRR